MYRSPCVSTQKDKGAGSEPEKKPKPEPIEGGHTFNVGQTLADGGEVVAVLAGGHAEGAALVIRPESGGSLCIRAPVGWSSNKKVPPKTILWKVPQVKVDARGEFMEWKFDGNPAKVQVYANKKVLPLADFIKEKNAKSVARHTPAAFPLGTPPTAMQASAAASLTTSDPVAKRVLSLASENPHVGLLWNVSVKEASQQVVPVGVVLYVKKQVTIQKDGEARLS